MSSLKFNLALACDNEAFANDPRPEIARILREVAGRIADGSRSLNVETVRDVNGNTVGRFELIRVRQAARRAAK